MDWDLSSYFDAFGSPGYRVFGESLSRDIQALAHELAEPPAVSEASHSQWVNWILDYENLYQRVSHLSSYLSCLASADAANEAYAAAEAALGVLQAEFEKLRQRIEWAFGTADAVPFEGLCADAHLSDAADYLRQLREDAQRRMSPAEESLASELAVNGSQAWSRLYFRLGGTLKFTLMDASGRERRVPMAQRNALLADPDRSIRQAAFDGGNRAWGAHEDTAAAALNALAGERLTLFRRRGIPHFLDEAARASRIERETLEALLSAIEGERLFAREILARRLKLAGIAGGGAYYDLQAPIGREAGRRFSWDEGVALVRDSFRSAYPRLGDFLGEMDEKRWIDHQPRENKRPGAFCTGSLLNRESRIFMSCEGRMSDLMTLAHECGHAWHSRILASSRALAANYPMTLAESASTFAEMILSTGVLQGGGFSEAQKRQVVDSDTERAVAFLLDIPVRFRFEEALYAERAKGTLSARRLREIMVEKQREAFGETLAAGGEDPLFWCSKLHFYIDSTFFYNYPYSFGYLLSLSLYARFREEGPSFLPAYERLLLDTGRMDCEAVVRENLGEDIREPAFWTRAIRMLKPAAAKLREWAEA